MNTIITKNQTLEFTKKFNDEFDGPCKITTTVRYDDKCGNGHNSFGVTGRITGRFGRELSGGCIHDDIAKHFPELEHLIKWHFMNSDGPMHYVANTKYHISDTDYDGLRKGEYSGYKLLVVSNNISTGGDITLFESGQMYTNRNNNKNLEKINVKKSDRVDNFVSSLEIDYKIVVKNSDWSLSEGKESDIEAARRSAIWPNATKEQLSCETALEAHRIELVEEFKQVITNLGMVY